MKLILLIALLVFPSTSYADHPQCGQIKIAIVDTGLDLKDPRFSGRLCQTGHRNFVEGEGLEDRHGHGTHVAGLVEKYAGSADYCMLIYKYYADLSSGYVNLTRYLQAIRAAKDNGATIINFSGGGPEFSEEEYIFIKDSPQITFVVAAGNDNKNLDIPGNEYYPASYFLPNEIPVGNIDSNDNKVKSSNWSKRVTVKEHGEMVFSTLPCTFNGRILCDGLMTGTSQATAIHTGKLVAKLSKTCNYRK